MHILRWVVWLRQARGIECRFEPRIFFGFSVLISLVCLVVYWRVTTLGLVTTARIQAREDAKSGVAEYKSWQQQLGAILEVGGEPGETICT